MANLIPMTEREHYAANQLARCSFQPGSFEKRFAKQIKAKAVSDNPEITEKGRACLWRLVYRYRRQIPDERLIAEANHIVNGAPLLDKKGKTL